MLSNMSRQDAIEIDLTRPCLLSMELHFSPCRAYRLDTMAVTPFRLMEIDYGLISKVFPFFDYSGRFLFVYVCGKAHFKQKDE